MRGIVNFIIREATVSVMIVVNALALFLDSFPGIHEATHGVLWWIDYGCVIYFLIEVVCKLGVFGREYWASNWNRFDFIVVLASMPTLLAPITDIQVFAIFLVFRLSRLIRCLRLFRFIPHGPRIWSGVLRALHASIGVFITLFILNLIFALGATLLFGKLDPQHFGNPIISTYSLFKIFTVEGWYEIPDTLAEQGGTQLFAFFSRIYFILAVMVGGILGLSLANAVFVDEMIADNTIPLESMVQELREEIHRLNEEHRQSLSRLHEENAQVRALLERLSKQ